jgi:ElaB/YqjD/DUF883 family membrane-anchored ribosome-binding protein
MTAEAHADLDLDLEDQSPFTQARSAEGNQIPSPVVEAAERLKNAAGDNVRRLRNAAEAGIKSFRETDAENDAPLSTPTMDELRDKAKALHREGEAWARENPTAAVAIAAGAGLVLGLLLRR